MTLRFLRLIISVKTNEHRDHLDCELQLVDKWKMTRLIFRLLITSAASL